jgi:Putative Actinobacterial Holin-X, holin superfamily III
MAAEIKDEQTFYRLYDQLSRHLETRWEYVYLSSAEKASGLAADVAGAASAFVFAVLVLFFFSVGFAWWLGDYIGSRAGGFALAGLIFVPLGLLFFRWVRPFVRTKVIQSILRDDLEKNKVNHE